MVAEPGHHPNRVYNDQSGDFHLNGAAFFDDAENDISDDFEALNGLAAELAVLDGFTGNTADLNVVAGADATGIARADLTQEDLVAFAVPLFEWRQADQAPMGITGTAGDHFYDVATNVHSLKGNTPSSSTVTDVSTCQFVLPAEYVSGETITVRAGCVVDAVADTNTIDFSVFKASVTDGSVGSDLVTTAATNVTATAGLKTFTVTPTGLVAGDRLNLLMTTVNNDADGSDGIVDIFSTDVLLDVKG